MPSKEQREHGTNKNFVKLHSRTTSTIAIESKIMKENKQTIKDGLCAEKPCILDMIWNTFCMRLLCYAVCSLSQCVVGHYITEVARN